MTDTDHTAVNSTEDTAAKRRVDIEQLRKLLYKNPKKFDDVRNAYKAALQSDVDNIKEQATYYLGIIDEVQKDEETKEKVRREKERSIEKLEKQVRKLEKQAQKLREKGEAARAEKLKNKADEKRVSIGKIIEGDKTASADKNAKPDIGQPIIGAGKDRDYSA